MKNRIEIWKAKIKAEIPGNIYPYHELDVRHILGNLGNLKIGLIYYFYLNDPIDPIIITQEPRNTSVHPGLSRFIGLSLRDKETWADAIVYTQRPKSYIPSIKWIELVETVAAKDPWEVSSKRHKIDTTDSNKILHRLLVTHSNDARIEIVRENEKMFVFNPLGRWCLREHIENHNGILATLKAIFNKIEEVKKENGLDQ